MISSLADPNGENRLSAHPLVKSMLKAIGIREISRSSSKSSIWNIEVLIKRLRSHPPDQDSIFQVSRHIAILLLLASGRRIHDLTLLSIGTEDYESHRNTITFWPIFGSKTDSIRHRQSGWKLSKAKQREFDMVRWVRRLIEISADRRKAVPGLLQLFITTRGKVKEASTGIIAGWIKTIFKELNINTKPGSIRSAVASYRFEQGMELDEILKQGNWRGAENFFKYYCKEVQKPKSSSDSGAVISDFEPIQ